MLTRPRVLLTSLSPFYPIVIDYANLFALMEAKRSKWFDRFMPDKVSLGVDLGKLAGFIGTLTGIPLGEMISMRYEKEFQRKIDDKLQISPAAIDQLHQQLHLLLKSHLRKGCYALNIEWPLETAPDLLSDLSCPITKPCRFVKHEADGLQHGTPVLVDAMMDLTDPEKPICVCDFPYMASRKIDRRVKIIASEEFRNTLGKHAVFVGGWHPFCRVFGRYLQIGRPEPAIEAIAVLVRQVQTLPENFCSQISAEWESLTLAAHTQLVYRTGPLRSESESISAEDIDSLYKASISVSIKQKIRPDEPLESIFREVATELYSSHDLNKIREFEDNPCENALGFLLRLKHFSQAEGAGRFIEECRFVRDRLTGIAGPVRLVTGHLWKESGKYLEALGSLRFTNQRLGELVEA